MSDLQINGMVPISEAVNQLKNCEIIICPDTNVLWHMVCLEKNMNPILQLNAWYKQMENCRVLLDNKKVGWLVPKQIIRELDSLTQDHSKNKPKSTMHLQRANDFSNRLKTDETIDNIDIYEINCSIEKLCNKLKSNIKNNCDSINNKSVFLEEDKSLIYKAWKLVHNNTFPNKINQQMKDTTILFHLHEFCSQLKKMQKTHSVYFWTFDHLGDNKITEFPHNKPKNYIKITHNITEIFKASQSMSGSSQV